MNSKQKKECHAIIHTASVACGTAGAIPIPIADQIPITAAQVTMILALAKVFDIPFSEGAAKTALASVVGPTVGRAVSKTLLSFVPVVGWGINASVAASLTETIGWIMAKEFDKKSQE
jgi:uncharacterized protein (DUF697 family)